MELPLPLASVSEAWILRPLDSWDSGFESFRLHICMSVWCCLVQKIAKIKSLFQSSPNECDVSEYNRKTLTWIRLWSSTGV